VLADVHAYPGAAHAVAFGLSLGDVERMAERAHQFGEFQGLHLHLRRCHFKIARVVAALPCRAPALPAASRLNTNDFDMKWLYKKNPAPALVNTASKAI
jgi:hypothetical protein